MDKILTVHDYYDGPRLGLAEWNGVPHIYEAEHDHSTEEYGDTYFLSSVEPALLALILEDWDIWLRWKAASERGEIPATPHGVLPIDSRRSAMIKELIGNRLRSDPENRAYVKAVFNDRMTGVTWHPAK